MATPNSASSRPSPPRQRFPLGSQYQQAIQHTRLCFRDPDLRTATPRTNQLGLPRPISGAFASIFDLTCANGAGRYAVKCFTRDVADQEHRYAEVSRHLRGLDAGPLSQPWKVGFDYLPDGILVEGAWYPVLKMQWVEAVGLMDWIESHLGQPNALLGLAERFASLMKDLEAARIGHGDLQHGNLLVAADGTLRLVDYDGMYVPALDGLSANENGHRNYQPPTRTDADFGPAVDRFSAWVIQLSLVALAVEPQLWNQLHESGGEYLLLAEEDFRDPAGSYRFPALLGHPATEVRRMAELVRDSAAAPPDTLPTLPTAVRDAVPGVVPPPRARTGAAGTGATTPTGGGGDQAALPAWMAGLAAQPSAPAAAATGQPVRFKRGKREPLLFAWFVLTAGLAVVQPASAAIFALWFLTTVVAYRTKAASRELRSRRRAVRSSRSDAATASAAYADAGSKRDEFDRLDSERIAQAFQAQQDFQTRQRHARTTLDRESAQQVVRLDTRLKQNEDQRRRERDVALKKAQVAHVRGRLAGNRIATARVAGIGPSIVSALRDNGITTADDFTGIRLAGAGRPSSQGATFILRGGREVRIPGVGEVKAERLDGWRRDRTAVARQYQPTSLPAADERAITAKYDALRTQLRAERAQTEASATTRKEALNRMLNAEQQQLADEERRSNRDAASARADLDRHVTAARSAVATAEVAARRAETEFEACRTISYPRYLRFVLAWG